MFIPLIVTKSTFFPFVFGKAIVFQVLVEIAFILWIIWRVWFFKKQDQKKSLKENLLNYSIYFFFLILFITTLTSLDSIRSFWSTQERMTGFFNWIHFGMFYIMLVSLFKKKDFVWILRTALCISLIASITALFSDKIQGRLVGTLGNAGFLAIYLLFHVFFSIWLLIKDRFWFWRLFYMSALILNLITLYYTRTRGAYLGLGVCLVLFIFINSIYYIGFTSPKLGKSKSRRRSKSWSDWRRWAALGVLFVIIMTALGFAWQQKSAFEQGSRGRVISWSISWNAFKERPLLGWGPENYILAFAKHFDPAYADYSKEWFDKAHNSVFEFLVTTGVFGLLGYLMILIFASIKSPKFIMPLFLAYFIASLFWMDTTASLMLLFLVLAMAQKRVFA